MKGGYKKKIQDTNIHNDESWEESSDIEKNTSSTGKSSQSPYNTPYNTSYNTSSNSSSDTFNDKNTINIKKNKSLPMFLDDRKSSNNNNLKSKKEPVFQYIYTDPKSDANNGWSEQLELDAKHIGEMCSGLRWMHHQSADLFKTRYWLIVILDAVLACVVVTFNSMTGASCINDTWNPFRIISLIGTAILGLVSTYGGVKNYGGRVTAHQFAEGNYQTLFHTIRNQLHKANRRERQFGYDFLEWIQKEYNDLSANPDAPDLPDYIVKQYEKLIKGRKIARYNEIEDITVVKHMESNMANSLPLIFINPETQNNEIPQKEIPQKEIPQKEIPQKEIPQKEIPQKEIPQKEISQKENQREHVNKKNVKKNSQKYGHRIRRFRSKHLSEHISQMKQTTDTQNLKENLKNDPTQQLNNNPNDFKGKKRLSLPKNYKITNSIALSEKERWQLNRFFRNV